MEWKKIWEGRSSINNVKENESCLSSDDYILDALIRLDGFDSGTGNIFLDSWKNYINEVGQMLQISEDDSIYEVGCGSGAFLYPFYIKGHHVGGMDFSSSLVNNARQIMKNMDFEINEAKNLSCELKYDFVVANSVFFYFPDYEYAACVLNKMVDKSVKRVLIMDIPDLETKNECEEIRRSAYPPGEYEKKYKDLSHLYFKRSWFTEFGLKNGLKVTLYDQKISNYDNSRFRFNCLIE
ncbi:MAG: class I SAM-dependent methyltransferase [Paludibacter sp.]|nr:class I SAM-dependent methyltransferase [Paludibacter sp.]